jgi:inorganic phosphate transporter, PiT family
MLISFLFISVCFLAYANDNFKGLASLFGSGIVSYRLALDWAALTTFAGSIAALFLVQPLMAKFLCDILFSSNLIYCPL